MDLVSTTAGLAVAFGVPALAVLFYAEGLVVGKVVQPPVAFVAFVAVTAPPPAWLAAVVVVCTAAATLGQLTLFRGFDDEAEEWFGIRRAVPYLDEFPERVRSGVGERRMAFLERVLRRHGWLGVCASNVVPGLRGLMTVPAGLSSYHVGRFVAAAALGNGLYVLLLVAVARGVVGLAGLV